jgi:hypothetical protein
MKGIRWMGQVAHMGEMRNSNKILIGKLEGKRPLK